MPNCRGTTKKGLPCRQSAGPSGYCHLHAPARQATRYEPPNVRTYPHTYADARGTSVSDGERRRGNRFLIGAGVLGLALFGILTDSKTPAETPASLSSAYGQTAAPLDSTALAAQATADSLDEARLVEEARAIPGSDLEGNRTAYAALASRYPKNPDYAARRDDYAGRIERRTQQAQARALRAATPRRSSGRRSSGGRQYITGPRGGCYYYNGNGNKTYVDHSYCS